MWLAFYILLVPLVCSCIWMLVLSVWLSYQALKGRANRTLDRYPKVGILIPHFNENPDYLLQSLDAIERQDYPSRLVVVLADDGSTNGIEKSLDVWLSQPRKQEYISIKHRSNTGRKGRAMDAALPFIPDDVEALVVVDSDTFLEEHSVIRVVERLWQDEKCAAACGFLVPVNSLGSLVQKLQYFEHIGIYPAVKSAQDVCGMVTVMAGAFVVHRMSVVREIGGWGEWIVEDIAWTWKALASGYSTGYASEAIAYTYTPTNVTSLLKQRRRWARGRVEAYRTAIKTSPAKAVLLAPFFLLYMLNLLPPTLFALPILAALLQQWWVFGLIGLSTLLSVCMFLLYQSQLPIGLRKGFSDIARSTYYNTLFELFLWRPNVAGFFDEVFHKRKAWMTR